MWNIMSHCMAKKKCARREQGSNVVLPSKRDRPSALADAVAKKGSCQLTGKGEPQPPGRRKKGARELKAKASLEGEPRWRHPGGGSVARSGRLRRSHWRSMTVLHSSRRIIALAFSRCNAMPRACSKRCSSTELLSLVLAAIAAERDLHVSKRWAPSLHRRLRPQGEWIAGPQWHRPATCPSGGTSELRNPCSLCCHQRLKQQGGLAASQKWPQHRKRQGHEGSSWRSRHQLGDGYFHEAVIHFRCPPGAPAAEGASSVSRLPVASQQRGHALPGCCAAGCVSWPCRPRRGTHGRGPRSYLKCHHTKGKPCQNRQ